MLVKKQHILALTGIAADNIDNPFIWKHDKRGQGGKLTLNNPNFAVLLNDFEDVLELVAPCGF